MTRDLTLHDSEKSDKYPFFKMLCMISLFIYIDTIFVLSYSDQYNIISKLMFAVTIGLSLINFVLTRESFKIDAPFILLLLFVTYVLVSSFWTVCDTGVMSFISTLLQLFVLFIIIRLNIRSEKDLRVVLWAIFVGAIIMCVYTVLFYGFGEIVARISVGERIGEEINQSNGMGIYCTLLSILSLYYIMWEKRYWCFAVLALALFVLVGAASRKSLILVVVSIIALFVFRSNRGRLARALVAIGVALILLYIVLQLADSNYFFYRIAQVFEIFGDDSELTDASLATRSQMASYGMHLFAKKPIFGYGPVQFEYYYQLLTGLRRPPHSTFVQVLVGYGIIGFSLFYGVYFYFAVEILPMIKKNRKYVILIVIFMLFFLANDIRANMLNNKFLYIFLGIFASYLSIQLDEEKMELKE